MLAKYRLPSAPRLPRAEGSLSDWGEMAIPQNDSEPFRTGGLLRQWIPEALSRGRVSTLRPIAD
jgi:hypothetical protein